MILRRVGTHIMRRVLALLPRSLLSRACVVACDAEALPLSLRHFLLSLLALAENPGGVPPGVVEVPPAPKRGGAASLG